jgi:hypothetical protein
MRVVIGVDPHKGSHTAVAIDANGQQLAKIQVRSGPRQLEQLLAWAVEFGERVWAVESAGGLGYFLGQQLVGAGEQVLDVPATLASRVRTLSTTKSQKTDGNDAFSIAIAARGPNVRRVEQRGDRSVLTEMARDRQSGASTECDVWCVVLDTRRWPTSRRARLRRHFRTRRSAHVHARRPRDLEPIRSQGAHPRGFGTSAGCRA